MRTLKHYLAIVAVCLAPATPVALAAAGREAPVPVRTVAPEYPRELKDSGVSGIVTVKVTIDEQGNVSEADVVKSSNEGFDRFATAALKKWKFKPGKQDGSPIAMQVTIPVKFVLDES
jgi:protein TonB